MTKLADGVYQVGTPAHGGLYMLPSAVAAIPDDVGAAFMHGCAWAEEDCEAAITLAILHHRGKVPTDQLGMPAVAMCEQALQTARQFDGYRAAVPHLTEALQAATKESAEASAAARVPSESRQAVYTDGCARPNPGPGGWAVVWIEDGKVHKEAHGHEREATTNNRMELQALIEAFKMLPTSAEVVIFSDSELAVNTITEWGPAWERRGWTRKGGPIKNLDLVQRVVGLAREHPNCTVEWIPGHAGNRWNEYVDELANRR